MEAAERAKLEEEIRTKQEEVSRIQEEVEIKDTETRRLQEEVEEARRKQVRHTHPLTLHRYTLLYTWLNTTVSYPAHDVFSRTLYLFS